VLNIKLGADSSLDFNIGATSPCESTGSLSKLAVCDRGLLACIAFTDVEALKLVLEFFFIIESELQ
jgi:hypothetical protein